MWKPQFVIDNGSGQNVSDYFLGPLFYPNGTNFSVNTFLSSVNAFWAQWAPVAQQHKAEMLVLSTENGQFASTAYTAQWMTIIATARAAYSGQLTYAENHFEPVASAPNVQFWGALDLIGIDDYEPLGNGTANTPYAYAYQQIFQNSLGLGPGNPTYDIPRILYDLHVKFSKPIYFTEFGTYSADGAMNHPPGGPPAGAAVNYTEQATYYQVNLDVFENYDWIVGLNVWNQENELASTPLYSNFTTNFQQYDASNYEFYSKPSGSVIQNYWLNNATPPPIVASATHNADGSFAGTASAPDLLVGGRQSDTFEGLGGVYEIVGGGGTDTAIYSGPSRDFTITPLSSGAFSVIDTTGAEGTGTLILVSRLQFSDTTVSLVNGNLLSAVLPSSRSVAVGAAATAFATLINSGPTAVGNCLIAPATAFPAQFVYQTTNPATNALTGSLNTPVSIAAGGSQSFVIAFTPGNASPPIDVSLEFQCGIAGFAGSMPGLNTLLLSASATPVPDIVALAASGDPGYVDIPGATGTGDFAVATINLGANATITATASTGSVTLPVTLTLCETNPTTGACMASPAPSVTTGVAPNATPTFGIFATGSGTIANSPGVNRVFVTFSDATGALRGETSVAIRTQ